MNVYDDALPAARAARAGDAAMATGAPAASNALVPSVVTSRTCPPDAAAVATGVVSMPAASPTDGASPNGHTWPIRSATQYPAPVAVGTMAAPQVLGAPANRASPKVNTPPSAAT